MRKQRAECMQGESREAFLRRAINDAGLTLKDFAVKAGLPVSSLGTILKRGIGTTSIDTAIKICDALQIDLETLVRGQVHSDVMVNNDLIVIQYSVTAKMYQTQRLETAIYCNKLVSLGIGNPNDYLIIGFAESFDKADAFIREYQKMHHLLLDPVYAKAPFLQDK